MDVGVFECSQLSHDARHHAELAKLIDARERSMMEVITMAQTPEETAFLCDLVHHAQANRIPAAMRSGSELA